MCRDTLSSEGRSVWVISSDTEPSPTSLLSSTRRACVAPTTVVRVSEVLEIIPSPLSPSTPSLLYPQEEYALGYLLAALERVNLPHHLQAASRSASPLFLSYLPT